MSKIKEVDTICYKINTMLDTIHGSVKTGGIDVGQLAHDLHEIRMKAQKMEDGLRHRREIMKKAGIEEDYQKYKALKTKPGTDGINLVADTERNVPKEYRLEVIVKEKGKVVYHHKGAAGGVISITERIDDMDSEGALYGVTQKFVFGPPLSQWFSFNQLQHTMEGKSVEILGALKNAYRLVSDPVLKKRMLDIANNRL